MVTSSARPSPTTSVPTRVHQGLDHGGDLVLGDVEPLDGHAHLAAGDEGGLHDLGRQGVVDLDVGGDDGRVVAAELEDHRGQPSEAPAMTARPVGTPPVNETMSTSRVGHQGRPRARARGR